MLHVCCYEADAYARVGRQAAADRGGVGEGGPLRPGHRPLPPLPVGRRADPSPEHANLGQRHLQPGAGRRLPGRRVAARRAAADRRRVGVDVDATSTATRASPRSPTRSTPRSSSAPTTRCCAAARSAPTRPPCRGTFRNWDYPIRRQIFAGFRCARDARPTRRLSPMCRHLAYLGPPRHAGRRWCSTPPHSLAAPVLGAARHARRRHGQRRRLRRRLVSRPTAGAGRATGGAAPIWSDAVAARRWPRRPAPAPCSPRSARPPSGMPVSRDGGRAVHRRAAGCSATTAWSPAGPDVGRRAGRRAAGRPTC